MWGSISVVASLDRQGTNISKDFGPSQKCKVQKKEKKKVKMYISLELATPFSELKLQYTRITKILYRNFNCALLVIQFFFQTLESTQFNQEYNYLLYGQWHI